MHLSNVKPHAPLYSSLEHKAHQSVLETTHTRAILILYGPAVVGLEIDRYSSHIPRPRPELCFWVVRRQVTHF